MTLVVWLTFIGVVFFTVIQVLPFWAGLLILGVVLLLHYLSFRARAAQRRSGAQGSDHGTATAGDGWSGSAPDRSSAPAGGGAAAHGGGDLTTPASAGVGAWLGSLWGGDASASEGSAGDVSGGSDSGGDSGGGGDGGGGGGD